MSKPCVVLFLAIVVYIIFKPIFVRINANIIACPFDSLAKGSDNIGNKLLAPFGLIFLLYIKCNGIFKLLSVYPFEENFSLFFRIFNTFCIAVMIRTDLNSLLLCIFVVFLEKLVLLIVVFSLACPQNGKIYARCLYPLPIDFSLML